MFLNYVIFNRYDARTPGAEIKSVVATVVLQNILDAGAKTSYSDSIGVSLRVTLLYRSCAILIRLVESYCLASIPTIFFRSNVNFVKLVMFH